MTLAEKYKTEDPTNPLPKGVNEATAFIYKTVIDNINRAKAAGRIPEGADLNAMGITAQILYESGNGSSGLSSKYNNFGGLKADSNWKGETVELNGTKWRKYATPEEGLAAQVDFYLNNPRYAENGVFEAKTPEEHLKAVAKAGYAGGEGSYVKNVMGMVNSIPNRLKKVKPELVPQSTTTVVEQPIEMPVGQGLGLKPTFDSNHQQATGMYNSLDYRNTQKDTKQTKQEQQVAQQQQEILDSPISMKAPEGWFGSGKSLFMNQKQYGGFINSYANGGPMEQLTEFNEGGTHEQSPLGGIPQGIGPNGQPNLVEQGETKLNSDDYIFSDTLKVDKEIAESFNLPKTVVGKTFADVSKKLNKPNSRREGDTIEQLDIKKGLDKLMNAQEAFKQVQVQQKLAEINSLDPNVLGSMMNQGQPTAMQPQQQQAEELQQPVDPAMMQQMTDENGGQQMDLGGWLKDNKQGVLGGLQAAAGIGAMFIPGAQGLGTNLITGGAKNIMGEVMQDNQPKVDAQQVVQNTNLPMGINFKYGGNMFDGITNPTGFLNGVPRSNINTYNGVDMTDLSNFNSIPNIDTNLKLPNLNYNSGYTKGFKNNLLDLENKNIPYTNINTPDNLFLNPSQMFSGNYGKDVVEQEQTLLNTANINNNTKSFVNNNIGNNSIVPTTETKKQGNYSDVDLDAVNRDISVNQTPLNALSNLAPVAYNTAMALKKPKKTTLADFYKPVNPIRPDYTAAENEAKNTYAQMQNSLRNSGLGAGSYISNMQQANIAKDRAMSDIMMAEENAYNQNLMQTNMLNNQNLLAGKEKMMKYNWAMDAARQEHGKEALTQFKDSQNANLQNDLASSYASLGAPDITKFTKWGYNPFLKSLNKSSQ